MTHHPPELHLFPLGAFGPITLQVTERGLCAIDLAPRGHRARIAKSETRSSKPAARSPFLAQAHAALDAWLHRQPLPAFTADLDGLTPFQRDVLRAMAAIPFGEVRTYGELAAQIGRPGGARAVGQACGANPIPILFPCHRIVSTQGLGGFSGGLGWKKRLLAHERAS